MKLKTFLKKFESFDGDFEVVVSDGVKNVFYILDDAAIKVSEDLNGNKILDIGVGGCEISSDMRCPWCGEELKMEINLEDRDTYIWCENCDYELES